MAHSLMNLRIVKSTRVVHPVLSQTCRDVYYNLFNLVKKFIL